MSVIQYAPRLVAAVIAVFLFAVNAFGNSEISDLSERIQESIAMKYRDRIASRIPSDNFQVSAFVSISPQGIETPAPTLPATVVLPPDRESAVAYRSLASSTTSISAMPNRLIQIPAGIHLGVSRENSLVSKIEISVRLSPRFGDEYRRKFEKWLRATALSDFGGVAGIRVLDSNMTANIQEPTPPGASVRHEQVFPGLALLILLLFLGAHLAGHRRWAE